MFIRFVIALGIVLQFGYQVVAQVSGSRVTLPHAKTYLHNHQNCGTEATPEDIIYLRQQRIQSAERERAFSQNYANRSSLPVMNVPIQAHILRQSNGTGGLTVGQLNTAIADMNAYFINASLQFFLCGNINYIDDDAYYNFDPADENTLVTGRDNPNAINIYFFNSIIGLCGYTRFPNATADRIMMANPCTINGSTLSHEMGHFYALYHTHGKTNTGTTDELVNGSNCTTHGDDICDTPADPNLGGMVDVNCLYTGTSADLNGDTYIPDPANIMSYSRKVCRNLFTPGQYARMNATAINSPYRNSYSCLPNDAALRPIPSFSPQICDSLFSPLVELKNQGTDTLINVNINYQIDNGAINTFLWTGSLAHNDNTTVTLPSVMTPIGVPFLLKAYTNSPNGALDGNTDNDSLSVTLQHIQSSQATQSLPYAEAFDLSTMPTNIELLNGGSDGAMWEHNTTVSGYAVGSGSIAMNNYSSDTRGTFDWFFIPPFDLINQTGTVLTFDVAYARYPGYSDTLLIAMSDSCNANYNVIYKKGGNDLATGSDTTARFIPTGLEWRTDTIYLSGYTGVPRVQLAFINRGGYGNVMYVDNINITSVPCNVPANVVATNVSCSGGTDGVAIVVGGGIGGYSFLWSNGQSGAVATNLAANSYTVTITDTIGCFTTKTVLVTEPIILSANVVNNGNGSATVNVSGGSPSYTYQWGANANGQTTATAMNLNSGTYVVTVTDVNGCEVSTTITMTVVGTTKIETLNHFNVVPNPNNGVFRVQVAFEEKQNAILQVTDVLGRVLREFHFDADHKTVPIDVTEYGSSVYFVVLRTDDHVITQKVSIQQ